MKNYEVDLDRIKNLKHPRIKWGIDPTGPDLHLGHYVVLRELKKFQDNGALIQLVIGDLTASIGDPTGRNSTRPPIDHQIIKNNSSSLIYQIGKILNLNGCEVIPNSQIQEDFTSILNLLGKISVNSLLSKDIFKDRKDSITMLEMMYPVLQARDSINLKPDLEVGGVDQLSNCHLGRELMDKSGLTPQSILLFPILTGTDGKKKMSKTYNNYILLSDNPDEMFGKTMSIPDTVMNEWYELLLGVSVNNELSLRDSKINLALEITKIFHGENKARAAFKRFEDIFVKKAIPSEDQIPKLQTTPDSLVNILVETGMVNSKSEARRSIIAGAVKVDTVKINDINFLMNESSILQLGKKKIIKVMINE